MLLARQKIAQNLLALGVPDLLQDHLLRSLRADPSHLHALDGFLDVFADLDVRIDLHRLVQLVFPRGHLDIGIVDDQPAPEKRKLTCDGIDGRPDINVLIEALLGRRCQRQLKRADDDVLVNVLLARQRIDQQQQFSTHIGLLNIGNQTRFFEIADLEHKQLAVDFQFQFPVIHRAQYPDEVPLPFPGHA